MKKGLFENQKTHRAVHINEMTVHDDLSIPHGGVKHSGFGRFNASAGIEEFLHLKTITWADGVTDG